MKFLIISSELIGSAICHRLIKEGADVKMCILNPVYQTCLEGIVPKALDWEDELSWVGTDGIIIFDDVGFGSLAQNLKKKGYKVIGGSADSDRLEVERQFFQKNLSKLGMQILESYDFPTATHAIDFVTKNPMKWVVKHTDHFATNQHVGEIPDGSDVIEVLKTYSKKNFSAHLQRRVDGVEVAVGRYFNGKNWVGPICINHEHKRLFNNDIGPLTPEMGTVVYFTDVEVPLYQKTLKKLEGYLKETAYIGYFDINCIIDNMGVWPLEATARFGTPITELHIEMLQSPLSDFLVSLVDGVAYKPVFHNGYGVVVSLAVPPFPFRVKDFMPSAHHVDETQIFLSPDLNNTDFSHLHFEEVIKREDTYYWSGPSGWVMHVTGVADSISRARELVYGLIRKISIPQMFYRTDIGERVEKKDIPFLKENNYI